MQRRPFLARTLVGAGATLGLPAFLTSCDKKKAPEAPAPEPPYVIQRFDAGQQRTLGAILDTMIPPGDPPGSPGAVEAGVLEFIDRQLGEDEFRRFEKFIKDGLVVADRAARRAHGAPFHSTGPAERTQLLESMQLGMEQPGGYPSATFFELVSTFALEGFYGAPFHGGNKDGMAWEWAGISMRCPERPDEPPPVGS